MSGRAVITENCSCGADFRVDAWAPHASSFVREWREGHRHVDSAGICGDLAPHFVDEDAPAFCNLKAGHVGMHSEGIGHWQTRPAETTSATLSDE